VIRQSDFYMICARPQGRFDDFKVDEDAGRLHFSIEVAGIGKDVGYFDFSRLDEFKNVVSPIDVRFEFHADHFIIWVEKASGAETPIAGFSVEDVLFFRGRKDQSFGGLSRHLELATYDLLYVGIAKVGDSYDRLFTNGHFARQQILASEPQREPGAKVSDETFLFLFNVEPLFVRTFGPESDVDEHAFDFSYDAKRLVADAEKAFVSLLKPNYNRKLYVNYPRGKDGLYSEGYTAYAYSISEGIGLRTKFGLIKGGRDQATTLSNEADFILVRGDEVTFHISGVDFAAE